MNGSLNRTTVIRVLAILFFCWCPVFIYAQTTIFTDPGMTYNNTDGPTGPDVYAVNISGCTSVSFSIDFSFSQPWEGDGNMEYCNEVSPSTGQQVCFGSPPCACDPTMSTAGGCNNCWDFLWVEFLIDGSNVGGSLIGGPGTTNADQAGTISSSPVCTDGASNAQISAVTQTWASNESVTFSNLVIVCWEVVPTAAAADLTCGSTTTNLTGSVVDNTSVQSWQWTNSGSGIITDPFAQNTPASNTISGEIFTLTTTDVNSCTASDMVTLTGSGTTVANDPNIPPLCAGDFSTTCHDLNQYNSTINSNPAAVINWFEGEPGNGGIFIATPFCTNMNSVTDLWAQVDVAGCIATVNVPFTINPSDNATFSYPTNSCSTSPTNPIPIILPSSSGNYSVDGGASINTTTGELNLSTTTPGNTYTVTFSSTGPCPATFDQIISINAPDDASFTYPSSACITGTNPTPTIPPSIAGNFSVDNGASINPSTGELDLTTTTAGAIYTVTYNSTGLCTASHNQMITINPSEDASFSFTNTACINGGNILPTTPPATAGTFTIDNGATINPNTGEVTISSTTTGINYTITYTTSGACPGTFSQPINIMPADDASFTFPASECIDATNPSPSTNPSSSGNYSVDNGAFINPTTGELDLSSTTAGSSYTITYNTNGSCPSSFDQTILINAADDASFSFPASECIDATNPSPSTNPSSSGNYSVDNGAFINPTTGELDLNTTFGGVIYTITYTTNGGCPNSFDQTILINLADDASFSFPASECIDATNPSPSTNPSSSGSYSVDNGASIDPTTGELDLNTTFGGVIYTITYTTNGSCPTTATQTITVVSAPNAGIPSPLTTACNDEITLINLNDLLTGEDVGGTWIETSFPVSTGLTGNNFDPNGIPAGIYTFEYTVPGQAPCNDDQSSVSVSIEEQTMAVLTPNSTVCNIANGENIINFNTLITSGPTTGQWLDSDGSSVDLSDPANVDFENIVAGNYTFTYELPATTFCSSTTYQTIIIVEACLCPSVVNTITTSICDGSMYTINGVDYNSTGIHTETIIGGANTGCDSTIVLDLTVNNHITNPITAFICQGEDYVINNIAYSTTGTHTEILPAGAANGCDSTIILDLTVNNPVTNNFNAQICNGEDYIINGVFYSTQGIHSETVINGSAAGCDSIIVLDLTVNDAITNNLTAQICTGDVFTINNVDYNSTGVHSETITGGSAAGCDSIIVLDLTVNDAITNNLSAQICTGDVFTINNVDYNSTGVHSETIIGGSATECDSIIVLDLTVNDAITNNLSAQICIGDVFTINNVDYNSTGVHSETVIGGSATGCDSIIVLDLTVNDAITNNLSAQICTGDVFTINNVDYNSTGVHSETIIGGSAAGCDSIIVLDLTVNDAITNNLSEQICTGDVFTINSVDYNSTGIHSETITGGSAAGCDSIIVLDLTVNDAITNNISAQICTGSVYTINNVDYNTTGIHTETITGGSNAGCDSIIILDLTVNNAITNNLSEQICTGDVFTINNVDYNSTGVHSETIIGGSAAGCDSIIVLNLTVNDAITNNLSAQICIDDVFTINNVDYNSTGIHSETITGGSAAGCDSIIVLDLTVNDAITNNLSEQICTGDVFTINNVDYNSTGIHSETITGGSAAGCDSIIVLDLTVNDAITNNLSAQICTGDVFTINNVDYNSTGVHSETIIGGSATGCDSIIVLDLTVNDAITNNLSEQICIGDVFTINNVDYNSAGIHSETITGGSAAGCDSIIVLDLIVNDIITNSFTAQICQGSFYTINNVDYTTTGIHIENIPGGSAAGCDSTIILNLTVNDPVTNNITAEICTGSLYTINNVDYNTAGIHMETVPGGASTGCDSIIILDLQINDAITNNISAQICTGSVYTINNVDYNTTGIHTETITGGSNAGCDSIIILDLTVNNAITNNLTQQICQGEIYTINNVNYNTTGIHTETIANGSVAGCDSIIVLDLTVNQPINNNINTSICIGEFYIINGTPYASTGTYTEIIPNGSTNGCDSTIVLDLVVNDAITNNIVSQICTGEDYIINGVSYNTQGIHMETITNGSVGGCDSIIVLDLTITDVVTNPIAAQICQGGFFTINNVDYTTTGIHIENIPGGSTAGCDSTIILNLTLNDPVTNNITAEICTGSVYTINNVDYNTAGIHMETVPGGASTGCDSIIILDLQINDAITNNISAQICTGSVYTINNVDYNTTGIHTETITGGSNAGCDSIIILDLTVNNAITNNLTQQICQGEVYTINNVNYNTTGIHTETIPNGSVAGCDSIIVLDLAVNQPINNNINTSICIGEFYIINGTPYASTGTYTEIIPNGSTNGCDSTIVLDLVVNDALTNNISAQICTGSVYTINNVDYNTTGIHTETITGGSNAGCDSIIILDLTVNNAITNNLTQQICQGEIYTINNVNYNTTGIHTETIPNGSVAGCDSIIVLDLTVNQPIINNINGSICIGEFYIINGVPYSTPGIHIETISNGSSNNCDSTIVLLLMVNNAVTNNIDAQICNGEEYIINDIAFNTSGIHMETVTGGAGNGCDSIIVLDLIVTNNVINEFAAQICEGEIYTINNNDYNTTGTHTETIPNGSVAGCDSTIILNLILNNEVTNSINAQICAGESYTINNVAYNTTGSHSETVTGGASTGCDSIIVLDLQVNDAIINNILAQICTGENYTINANDYNTTGIFTEIITNGSSNGCDSIINLDLTVTDAVINNLSETLCGGDILIVNGTLYDFNNTSGTETIANGSVGGCDSIINVDLSFHPELLGSIIGDATICPGESADISFILEGGNTYDLVVSINGTTFNYNNIDDGFVLELSPVTNSSTVILEQVSSPDNPCNAISPNNTATISINQISALVEVESDFNGYDLSCEDAEDGVAVVSSVTGIPPYNYLWDNGSMAQSLENIGVGNYQVTITDALGCTIMEQVSINTPPAIQLLSTVITPECYEDNNGVIIIDTIIGGMGPYEFSYDGEFFTTISGVPFTIPRLEAGNYDLIIQDVNDCFSEASISIPSPPEHVVDLGPNITIILGEEVRLGAQVNFTPDSLLWGPTSVLDCEVCQDSIVRPMLTTVYTVIATDTLGCDARDEIIVTVEKPRNVFIPNSFSPNGDGFNDIFFINSSREVEIINQFTIYDRWGEIVFNKPSFFPNDPGEGWDGQLNGKLMNPAVFIYYAEIKFIDGHVERYKGDLTLLR